MAGDLDPTYGAGGKVITPFFDQTISSDSSNAVVMQSDGKLITGGVTESLFRFSSNGALDTTFGDQGKVVTRGGVNALAVDAQDRIIGVGSVFEEYRQMIKIVRFLPNGQPDAAFGNGGTVISHINNVSDQAVDVLVQPDGKILVGIKTNSGTDNSFNYNLDFALQRYNSDGSLDTGFGTGGQVVTSLGGITDSLGKLLLQPDNRIVAVGSTSLTALSNSDTALVRYLPNGSLDSSFDGDGIRVVNLSTGNYGDGTSAVSLLSDGRILVGGGAGNGINSDFLLARFQPDGSLDSTFNQGGPIPGAKQFTFGSGFDGIQALAPKPNGQFWALGVGTGTLNNTPFNLLMRFNSDGTFDTNYDSDGRMEFSYPGYAGATSGKMIMRADESLVTAGVTQTQTGADLSSFAALVGFSSAGAIDTGFGASGFTSAGAFLGVSTGNRGVLQSDGKLIVVGTTTIKRSNFSGYEQAWTLARYNTDGSLDTSFGGDGKVTTSFPNGLATEGTDIALQPDGSIVVLGRQTGAYSVGRYFSDGTLDTSFGNQGTTLRYFGRMLDIPKALAIEPNGKIVTVGYSQDDAPTFGLLPPRAVISQLNADGTNDTSFGSDGALQLQVDGIGTYATSVVALSDGKILVAGYTDPTQPSLFVARLLPNGALDATFGVGGIAKYLEVNTIPTVWDMKLQADGKIVLVGDTAANPRPLATVTRLNPDGSLDSTFGTAGISKFSISPTLDTAQSVAIAPDGKIVVSASSNQLPTPDIDYFTTGVVRLLPNGVLDTSFGNAGTKMLELGVGQEYSRDVLVQQDGKILVVGDKSFRASPNDIFYGGDVLVARLTSSTLTVNQVSVSVNEGSVATNSGNWNSVATISASVGTVVKNGDGTWSWQYTTTDGPNQSQSVTITATETGGAVLTTTFSLVVSNVAPILSLSGAATVNAGATYSLSLSAIDPGADTITSWTINWGDGVIQTIAGNPSSVTHVYTVGGVSRTITATATDEDGTYTSNSISVTIIATDTGPSVTVEGRILKIIGTNNDDEVRVIPYGEYGVKVLLNGKLYGPFALMSFDEIDIYGKDGDDDLQVASSIEKPAIILGGDGDDRLKGGGGKNVIVGGLGDDRLNGGSSQDILIGSQGEDRLVGEGGGDILIGGYTLYDTNVVGLRSLLAEWSRDSDYRSRQNRLRLGGGLNGSFVLSSATVKDDNAVDRLTGSSGRDWFFAQLSGSSLDLLTDKKSNESVN